MAQGKSNAAIAAVLTVSERAVEKHTNSIFAKLGLSEEKELNRRVKAVLLYLSEPGPVVGWAVPHLWGAGVVRLPEPVGSSGYPPFWAGSGVLGLLVSAGRRAGRGAAAAGWLGSSARRWR